MKIAHFILFMFSGTLLLTAQDTDPGVVGPDMPDWSAIIPRWGDYLDVPQATVTWAESVMLKNWDAQHSITADEIDDLWPTVAQEYLARRYIASDTPPVLRTELIFSGAPGTAFHQLCDGFLGGTFNRKKRLCNSRWEFLMESARVVDDLVNTRTRYKINAGVCEQVEEKYTRVMGNILLELYKMKREKDRRSFIKQLIE